MEEKLINTHVETNSKLLNKGPSWIYWMTANPATLGTAGTLGIYDGFDNGGKKVFEVKTGYDRFNTFLPPISCNQGIYVEVDAAIDSYVVGYSSKKRGEEG